MRRARRLLSSDVVCSRKKCRILSRFYVIYRTSPRRSSQTPGSTGHGSEDHRVQKNRTKEISPIKIRAGYNNCTARGTVQVYEHGSSGCFVIYDCYIICLHIWLCREHLLSNKYDTISLFLAVGLPHFSVPCAFLERDFVSFPGSFFLFSS